MFSIPIDELQSRLQLQSHHWTKHRRTTVRFSDKTMTSYCLDCQTIKPYWQFNTTKVFLNWTIVSLCGSSSVLGTEPGPTCILLFYVPKLFVSVTLKSEGATGNLTVSTSRHPVPLHNNGSQVTLSFPKMPHFLWRMVCSNVIIDHLETSNAKMDLRNAFSSKFYVDPCLADIFFKVILRRKLKIEKRSDFFSPKNV